MIPQSPIPIYVLAVNGTKYTGKFLEFSQIDLNTDQRGEVLGPCLGNLSLMSLCIVHLSGERWEGGTLEVRPELITQRARKRRLKGVTKKLFFSKFEMLFPRERVVTGG